MIRAQARAEALGERAAESAAARLAARIGAEPGMAAEVIEGGVAVSGRGLRRRLLWFGGMVR